MSAAAEMRKDKSVFENDLISYAIGPDGRNKAFSIQLGIGNRSSAGTAQSLGFSATRPICKQEKTTMGQSESDPVAAKMAELIREVGCLITTDFTLQVGGSRAMDELVQAGYYDGVHSFINQEKFPLEPRAPVEVVIQLIDLGRIASSEEALEEFTRCGLRRPTCEEAVYFGARYPDAQRHRPIVWPHEPYQHADGTSRVFVHFGGTGYRSLDLYIDSSWGAYCLFAGVRD